jgi:prepilin-type N-terminal cleavage/methylation domain-containing protein
MLSRRGFTLVELMVSVVLLGIIAVAGARVLRVVLNTTSAQMGLAASQGAVRVGVLALPQEFREIGYDSIPVSGAVTSDLEAIAAHQITLRAMRGLGLTCGTPTLTAFTIRKPVMGIRGPLITDGFLLFVESDPNYGLDDQWVPMQVTVIDSTASCGGQAAITFTLAAPPELDPVAHTAIAISQVFVGGPIRWYERVQYGAWRDPADGVAYLGFRSLSLGQRELSPILGPLVDTTGFALTYYSANGDVLDPQSASPVRVRSIGLDIHGATAAEVSLAGSTRRSPAVTSVSTRVALRNSLRP